MKSRSTRPLFLCRMSPMPYAGIVPCLILLYCLSSPLGAQGRAPSEAGWFDKPMRWAQLTLVENDPGNFDPAFWLDYFRRTHSDAACLSAGGCVAYYPTDIPFHHRSAWLEDSDPFGKLVAGCRKMEMVVIARTDPHSVLRDVYDNHPDWIAVDENGNKIKHWAAPGRWVTCALGPYNFEFMTEVHKEIMSRYMVDGIFSNRWSGSGMCYCEHCVKNFRDYCGMELPRTNDPKDASYRNYLVWRQKRLFELWQLWDREIRKINPNARYIPNTGGGALSTLDMKTIGEYSDILFSDRQARSGLAAPWMNGKTAKEYRATMGNKPVGGIFSVGTEERYRWKDSFSNEAEIRLWTAEGIANGMRPWFTKFSGVFHDRRWLPVVEEIYKWHKSAERYLRNTAPLARVGLVYSQQTGMFYGGPEGRRKVEDAILGMYEALIEARIPFEMVHDGLLAYEKIRQFKTLVLPNIAALSDKQCDELREFVQSGGSIVATHETSLYDEWGDPRENLGLADVFGVVYAGKLEGPMQNSYLRIEKNPADGSFHPLLAGLEDAERIINGVNRVEVKAAVPFPNPPLTLVPSYPDLPMEEVYPRHAKTDIPEVYIREIDNGRVVYFPWDIDRTFWEVMHVDHYKLLRNAILWATNEELPATVTGPGVIDVAVWRQEHSMTVNLVNLTNPMLMKGPIRELMPVGAQEVKVKIPQGVKPVSVKLLKAGTSPEYQVEGDILSVTVPSILDIEIVAIDLE